MQMKWLIEANTSKLVQNDIESIKPIWQTVGCTFPQSTIRADILQFECQHEDTAHHFIIQIEKEFAAVRISNVLLSRYQLHKGITEPQFDRFKAQINLKPTVNYMFRCWWVSDEEELQFIDLEEPDSEQEQGLRKELPPEIVDEIITLARNHLTTDTWNEEEDERIITLLREHMTAKTLFASWPSIWCHILFTKTWTEFLQIDY